MIKSASFEFYLKTYIVLLMIALLLLGTVVLELLIYGWLWKFRLALTVVLTLAISSLTTFFVFEQPNWLGGLVAILSLLRLFNLLRIAKQRMHEQYLRRATRNTTYATGFIQAVLLGFATSGIHLPFSTVTAWQLVALIQLLVAVGMLATIFYNIKTMRYRQGHHFYADKELPTVSVLIPARNETHDLEACLRGLLVNDYPKLEIIVLDDCSHVKTSDIIKKFAHDGVRFIKGSEPNEKWLAKNAAYERLRKEATGEVLLFCGVDVRFGPHALRALVTELQVRDKDMISILPRRLSGDLANAFIQPMRYWWELALPRKLFNRPAVLSTCWLIRKEKLDKLGGFAGISRSVIPERFFARELIKPNKYSFIRANDTLDVQTVKSFHEQQATAIRTKYPQLSKRPELVLNLIAAEALLLLGPFIGIAAAILVGNSLLLAISILTTVVLIFNHITIIYLTNPANGVVALWNLPLAILGEMAVTVASMVKYELGDVIWKERNVCIPVMHVVPRLPDLSKNK